MKLLITSFIILIAIQVQPLLAQSLEQQMEFARTADMNKQIDQAIALMNSGEYKEADKQFREVLVKLKVLPSNLAFHIGKNSFYLEEYKQSIDWLNKYIELKGTKGMYYFEASKILKESEKKIIEASGEEYGPNPGTRDLYSHNYLDCEGKKVICPVCGGKNVIVEKGKLNNVYKTCPYCNEKGLLTCDEYNLLIQGKLQPRTENK